MKINLFEWLVEYHTKINLQKCLPHIVNGVLIDPFTNLPLKEGEDKRQLHSGLLLLANGSELPETLKKNDIILDDILEDPVHIDDKEAFFKYLIDNAGIDGAYIFNTPDSMITHVSYVNNTPNLSEKQRRSLLKRIPDDFVFSDGRKPTEKNIGNRTYLADLLPLAYPNIHAYQIKQSAYNSLGLGKVTHFNVDGLVEEFFFRHKPAGEGNYAKNDELIIGVHRKYDFQTDRPDLKSQRNSICANFNKESVAESRV